MKEYVIRDSEGQKTTIYAKNITHTLSYVEDSKKLKDESITIEGDWTQECINAAKRMGLTFTLTGRYENGYPVAKVSGDKQKLIKYFKKWYDPDFFEEGFDVFDSKHNSINENRVKDEASSATTINALIEDEKSATEAYNVAISNLKDMIDAEAMQVLINIRNDERRHIENLYSILNGNITEKNLEDSKIADALDVEKYAKHGWTITQKLPYDIFNEGRSNGSDFNTVLKNYDSIAKQILAKVKDYLDDAKKTLMSFKSEY